jgi:alpha-1,3-mannosyltransferase
MDWVDHGNTFYDSWISRGMTGDMFIEIPQSGSFDFKQNLFWNDPGTKKRFEKGLPFQVYSCWNGGAVFTARPLLKHNVTFRASYKDECYMGEPTLFCKDFWAQGFGRIAVVPSVNVGYNDDESRGAKQKFGYASDIVWKTEKEDHLNTHIHWKSSPPDLVKCEPDWVHPSWVRWDEAKDRQVPFDWTHSGYFNAHHGDEEETKDAAFEENSNGFIFDGSDEDGEEDDEDYEDYEDRDEGEDGWR